jgi:peptidoglycan glycosyltransferase
MENSCNTSFAQLGVELGADALKQQAEKFGFNDHYLDDLGPQAVSVYPAGANKPETGQTGFGQFDVKSTPLQMAMVAAGIANGGTVMKPYLVDGVESADLQPLDKTNPTELSRAVSPTTANELTKLMVATVNDGTASPGAIDGVEVAGKTGTAQSGVPGTPPYAWYVSFAPADDPQVAVAVMIQHVDRDTGEIAGGLLGGPIAKAVMEAVIR